MSGNQYLEMTLSELQAAERRMLADVVRLTGETAELRRRRPRSGGEKTQWLLLQKSAELRRLREDSWPLWARKVALAKSLGVDPWSL